MKTCYCKRKYLLNYLINLVEELENVWIGRYISWIPGIMGNF